MQFATQQMLHRSNLLCTLHNQIAFYSQIYLFANITVKIFLFYGYICHYLKYNRYFSSYFTVGFPKTIISTLNRILNLRLQLQTSETSRNPFKILPLNNQKTITSRNLTQYLQLYSKKIKYKPYNNPIQTFYRFHFVCKTEILRVAMSHAQMNRIG